MTPQATGFEDLIPAPQSAGTDATGFEDLAPPTALPPKAQAGPEWGAQIAHAIPHTLGLAGRAVSDASFALPNMAGDFGVGLRNLFGKMTGGQSDFEYPSDMYRRGADQLVKPENRAESIESALAPILIGAGATRLTNAASIILGGAVPTTSAAGAPMFDAAGNAVAQAPNTMTGAQTRTQMLADTLRKSHDLDLVVPRATTNPTMKNRLVEMLGGKVGTAQESAVRNQAAANRVGAEYVGVNPEVPLSVDQLRAMRTELGQGYQAVRRVGDVATDTNFRQPLNEMQDKYAAMHADFPGSTPSPIEKELGALDVQHFGSNTAMDKIISLRDKASAAFRGGENDLGGDYKKLATLLEDQIDRHISTAPGVSPDTITNFRNARTAIAKTHTIEDAIGPNGDVSIAKLASMKKGGEYMTGDLSKLADFGNTFKKAAQSPAAIGSAGVNHLEGGLTGLMAAALGTMGGHEHGTLGMLGGVGAGMALPFVRRGAVNWALGPGQSAAIPKAASALNDLGPTRAKAALLAQMLQQRHEQSESAPTANQ
jgi:hypothetical protein